MNQNRSELAESLEALTGGGEHLEFIRGVISHSELPPKVGQDLLARVERIERRRADPNLYMAVIGEFSSGKSTFINALLRDDLLPANALVTTAAATRLRHGGALEAQLVVRKPRGREVKIDAATKEFSLSEIPELNARNIRAFIQAVTSQDAVASKVSALTIIHPAAFLSDGIVVIDTPGTNATNTEHATITARVVEEEADAAIIIVPAIFPLSQTLVQFLAGQLQPCLHRCVFVVTRMDQIRPNERAGLLAYIRERLEAELGVKLGAIHACSAQVVIDALDGGAALPPGGEAVWKDRFAELEREITGRLLRERKLSIAERIVRLLTQLFEELEGHLKGRQGRFAERRAALEREVIRDLGSFTKERHKVCKEKFKQELAKVRSKVDDEVARFKQAVRSSSRSAVFGITDTDEVAGLQRELEGVIKKEHEKFCENVGRILKGVGGAAETVGKFFDKEFAEQYRRLAAIEAVAAPKSEALQKSDFKLNTDTILEASMKVNSELSGKEDNWVGGLGVLGFAVGSAILPVIGSILGAMLGGWLGRWFGPSLSERQEKVWAKLDPEIERYLDSAAGEARGALDGAGRSAQSALDKRVDAYISKYKSTVDAMVRKQNGELEELRRLERTTQSDLAEIDRRRQALAASRQRLAAH